MESRTRTRIRLSLAVATVALCTWVALDDSATIAAQSNFVGGEPSRPDSSDIRTLRLRFESGSRSNWHSHSNWQILMHGGSLLASVRTMSSLSAVADAA